ncbi:MAG: MFS transporter [Syntrophaceae bacterium]|nr:MFS transporter [Syntrophaceae bacterium]
MQAGPKCNAERTPWPLVLLLVGAGVVSAFQVGKAPPMLGSIRADLGMSLFLAGWILSIFNLIGLLLGSIAGALSDAFGHRRLLLIGLSLQAMGSLLGSLAPAAALLLATRAVEGLGFLAIVVAAPAMVAQVSKPGDIRIALSIWSCFLPAGASFIMFTVPLASVGLGWRELWGVNFLILALYALWLLKGTAHLPRQDKGPRRRLKQVWLDLRLTATSPGPVLLGTIFATYTLQWLAVMGFLPTLLVEEFGLSPGRASVFTAIMVAMNVPGNLMGGWLLHRGIRRWKLIAFASIVMGACSVAIYSGGLAFAARYAACLTFSLIGGLLPASTLGAAPLYAPTPRHVATTNGLIMQGGQMGQVIGPPVLALIVSMGGGWKSAPWLLAGAAAAGVALSLGLAILEKRGIHRLGK